MPTGVPRMGLGRLLGSKAGDLTDAPGAEVLGEVKAKGPAIEEWWDDETKTRVALEEGPPPWEQSGEGGSDARQFVMVPEDWVLYWINPRQLDAVGWRGWQHVRQNDPRVQVLVPSMVSPEGMIRRGGPTGDILAYMPRHWYEVRKRQFAELNARQTQASVDRLESLKEQINSGAFSHGGPVKMHLDAVHPTHTMADGRSMTD
jgi:hypothetical protein